MVGMHARTKSELHHTLFRHKMAKLEEESCRKKALDIMKFVGLKRGADYTAGALSRRAEAVGDREDWRSNLRSSSWTSQLRA